MPTKEESLWSRLCKSILEGKIIEEYPQAKPYPACLMMTMVEPGKPLYVSLAYDPENDLLHISGTTGARIYRHTDGRRVVIHYHHGGDTLTRKTLRSILGSLHWDEADFERLGL